MPISLKQFKLIYACGAVFSFIFICTFTILQKKQFSSSLNRNSNNSSYRLTKSTKEPEYFQISTRNNTEEIISEISNNATEINRRININASEIMSGINNTDMEIISEINNTANEIIISDFFHQKWDPRIDVLVFLHIQKTGGTFFETELDQVLMEDGDVKIDSNLDSNLNAPIRAAPKEYYYKPACSCVFIFARCKCASENASIWLYVP